MENPSIEKRIENIENQNLEILQLLKGENPILQAKQGSKSTNLLTKREYAKAVKKSVTTIDRWVSDGRINPIMIGSVRYFEDPISQYLSK